MLDHGSRYYHLETAVFRAADGREIAYKRRRFLPQGDRLPLLAEAVVSVGDRIDLIAARTLGSPDQFWQVCDANDAMHPATLTAEPGRRLRIPTPQYPSSSVADGPGQSASADALSPQAGE